MIDVSLVFLNFLSKNDIIRALDSVLKDIANCPYNIKITVADNSMNKDGVKEALTEKFPNIPYFSCGDNVGFGRGLNMVFAQEEARYYMTLNPDTVIPENTRTIERMVKFMDEHPKIGMIGPKVLNMDGSLQYSCYRFDFPSIAIKPLKQINWDKKYAWVKKYSDRLLMKDFDHNETRPVDWVMGSVMMARKEATDKVGFFDDRYFMYMEDSDWCRRMWEANWPVYFLADVSIYHAHARDSAKVPGIFKAFFKNKLARIHFISWLKYMWKWKGNNKYYSV